ncbi:MAG: DUF1343 domain-containing protein [Verrucomicrobiae bacterium]|nr:DUF1343 domain-containing protein [Verrucomicrobiae bacterium]
MFSFPRFYPKWTSVAILLVAVISQVCQSQAASNIMLGIDVLQQNQFSVLKGKRVGLLTHKAGVNRLGISTIDILQQAPNVNLRALYGPEHGIDGVAEADVKVNSGIHRKTGLPVYSLYGEYRKPIPSMLQTIDTMVVDLQDIGVRSYTYVACMKLTMEACFENNKEVIILDRPNPLGGIKVDGPPLEEVWESYVGPFPTPYLHGLTIGEIAKMAKATPGWLDIDDRIRQKGRLTIIRMQGWNRHMLWPDTGLPWIATSPNIPNLSAVLGYPMTGLGAQVGGFKHGIGTQYPFRMLTFPGVSSQRLQQRLTQMRIPGLLFEEKKFIQSNGKSEVGVYTTVTDYQSLRPTELSFYMMKLAAEFQGTNPFSNVPFSTERLFNKHVGSTAWWKAISSEGARINVAAWVHQWEQQALAFREKTKPFWLYR